MTNQTDRWTLSSSVSGDGYGFAVYRQGLSPYESGGIVHYADARFAVRLGFAGAFVAFIPCESFTAAYAQGERFADCWRAWRAVQAREAALARGIAVLGGAR